MHKFVHSIYIEIYEGIPIKDIQISSVEPDIEDIVEFKEEWVQETKKEDPESDDEIANTQTYSRQQTETKAPSRIVQKNHPESQLIGDKNKGVQTRRKLIKASEQSYISFLSMMEPKNIEEASEDDDWVKSMNEELGQIEKNNTWELVPRLADKNVIGSKQVFKNKMNEQGQIVRNKSRLVYKGYAQVEG